MWVQRAGGSSAEQGEGLRGGGGREQRLAPGGGLSRSTEGCGGPLPVQHLLCRIWIWESRV